MIETAIILFLCLPIGWIFYDLRRKSMRHHHIVAKEKSEIATITKMTAHMSTFSPSKQETKILAASDDLLLFFYRRIIKGKLTARYSIHLHTVTSVRLALDGLPFSTEVTSKQPTPALKATEISHEIVAQWQMQKSPPPQSIGLEIRFLDEAMHTHIIQIPIFVPGSPTMQRQLPKLLENTLWWHQYLTLAVAGAKLLHDAEHGEMAES